MLKISCSFIFLFVILLGCKSSEETHATTRAKLVVIGYVPGFRGELDEKTINANKLTHINYAFVDVKDSMAWLTNIATDSINFRKLNYLKKDNPDLKILISIGGWSWSNNFSDAVLTENSRKKFAQTSANIVEQYNFDGIDIDWEYPGMRGEDNMFRTEDKENFTLMFRAIREALNELAKKTGKTYQVTTALPCFPRIIDVTEIGKAAKYIDYVNLMAYDFYVAGDTAGHHSNLYPSESYQKEESGDKAYDLYTKAGVPAEKLVLGIPFYGRSWFMKTDDNYGINRLVDSVTRGGGYTFIKDSIMSRPGFERRWDDKAKAPYLWNPETRQLVVYDDEESVRIKCEYVKAKNMGGVMFWQYASDPKEYLLTAVNEHLYK
ncbi:MAG TPA: glycoside hydrolase family 18 protein [Cyclobacteriaceae bacterium]|nr:glycoside hydrolase family 18 protein [Cyclobacteriaceae bacterium]